MKIAIVTAICGIKNELVDPEYVFEGVDYIAFVDKKYPCNVWDQKDLVKFTLTEHYANRRNAKIYKVLPHLMLPGYDYYFWVDATHEVIQPPLRIIEDYLRNEDLGVFRHPQRNCVYTEAMEVLRLNYDEEELVNSQIDFYKKINYPEFNGLLELSAIIRKNTPATQLINLRWWELICKYSSRDQLSLPVVLWSLGVTPAILPGYANNGLDQNSIIPQKRWKIWG